MSFKVHLYTFAKRDNSTKQPTGSGDEFSCVLKSGSGIMHPVLSFDLGIAGDPSQYNYAYIPAFDIMKQFAGLMLSGSPVVANFLSSP